jgi:hypothetical protein
MDPNCMRSRLFIISFLLVMVLLASCGSLPDADSEGGWTKNLFSLRSQQNLNQKGDYAPGTFPVDPLFHDFYEGMGGEETLGPAISPAKFTDSRIEQFTENSLLVYDAQQPLSSRFKLGALGIVLGVGEGGGLGDLKKDGRLINGFQVAGDFLVAYEALGGARFVGRPISETVYNTGKQRFEQYFENLGFFQLEGQGKVHLLPYGAYACDRNCRNLQAVAAIPGRGHILPESFLHRTLELGLQLAGKPLTGLHNAGDGMLEVIFENLVLVAGRDSRDQVELRPIAELLGKYTQPPVEPKSTALNTFVEIEAGLGYNVPNFFIEFLQSIGGLQVSGQPISEVYSPEPGIYVQCYANLCLQFDLNAEQDQRLSPLLLGVEYKLREYEVGRDFYACQALENIEIKVWEGETYVAPGEPQEIHVAIFEDGKPLENYEPLLIATMPDGSQRKAYLQPSDQSGRSAIKLAPIEAPNGTLIAYQVCVFGIDQSQTCVGDNYLIWDAD